MKKYIILVCVFFAILIVHNKSFAQGKLSIETEGRYFTVYSYSGFDAQYFLSKLDYDYFSHPDSLNVSGSALAKTLDILFAEVSDILDLHSYNFHGTLKIVKNQGEVSNVFKKTFGQSFSERSLFLTEENTIIISDADVTLGMLGHEIAHAIICHYFVVPPPAKTQEVLAGYVEYSLRKKTGTLPKVRF